MKINDSLFGLSYICEQFRHKVRDKTAFLFFTLFVDRVYKIGILLSDHLCCALMAEEKLLMVLKMLV